MWLAYVLLCRDIELACDEKVIKELNTDCRADYSQALLSCSIKRRSIAACPLAFGEVGVKQRIKSVLSYKKPAFWLIVIALLSCIALAVCFLTNPKDKTDPTDNVSTTDSANQPTQNGEGIEVLATGSHSEAVGIEVVSLKTENNGLVLSLRWNNNSDYVINYGEPFKVFKEVDGEWIELDDGGASWTLPAYPVNPWAKTEKEFRDMNRMFKYNLSQVYDLTEKGKYRFVTDFSFNYDGTKQYSVWVDFSFGGFGQDYSQDFSYKNPSNFDTAHLTLFPQVKEFRFYYSMLSSYCGGGVYEEKGDKLLCKTHDGKNTYTFKKQGDTYIFLADESSEVPEYKYGGANGKATACVPDGAVFATVKGENPLEADYNFDPFFDRISFDVDNDGVEEACSLKYGPTSGLFTFIFEISQEGKREYFNVFHSTVGEVKFISENGELKLQGSGTFDDPTPRVYDISFADGNIVLTHNGESMSYMGYWGMQGILSPLAISDGGLSLSLAIDDANREKFAAEKPDGLIHAQAYRILDYREFSGTPYPPEVEHKRGITICALVYSGKYRVKGDSAELVSEEIIPAAITFRLDNDNNYSLESYLIPSDEGEESFGNVFPKELWEKAGDTEKYVRALRENGLVNAQIALESMKE